MWSSVWWAKKRTRQVSAIERIEKRKQTRLKRLTQLRRGGAMVGWDGDGGMAGWRDGDGDGGMSGGMRRDGETGGRQRGVGRRTAG